MRENKHRQSLVSFLILGCSFGLIMPLICLVFHYFILPGANPIPALILWPSSILMLATDGREQSAFGVLVIVFSVLINIILYGVTSLLLWFARNAFSKK